MEPLSDSGLLERLRGIYSPAEVDMVARELAAARESLATGRIEAGEEYVQRIHRRYTYRMHDLSEFMKTLLQRFIGSSKLDVKKTGLRTTGKILSSLKMSHEMLELEVMQLPDAQRAALAAHLLRSLPGVPHEEDDGIAEAMRRDAELDRDPSAGMSLEEFRSALGR